MSDINFPTFPAGSTWKMPLFWLETDPSQAGSGDQPLYELYVAEALSVGTAPANVPIAVASLQQAQGFFGIGSPLERMFARAFAINPAGVKFCIPLGNTSGAAAHGVLLVTAPPTDNGILSLYVAGQRVQVAIEDDLTIAEVATAIVAAVNAIPTLNVVAGVDSTVNSKVNLTAKWQGASGNDIDLRFNYRGTLGGEAMPAGLAITVTPMTGGTGTPDMSAAIQNLGDGAYEFVGMPYTDTVSQGVWDTEYGFSASGRWGWMRQLYGSVYTARRDTFSNLFAWGPNNNSPVISVMPVEPTSPSPIWEWTAAYTAAAAAGLLEDPARPLQTLEMSGILPAPKADRWTLTESNGLAGVGLAAQQVGSNGYPVIMVESTEWQVNAFGASDNAFGLVTTLATLSWLYRRFKQAITSKYPRQKLANDGTKFASGQAIITPSIAKAEIVSEYKQAEYLGMVENSDQFIANLIVRRNSTNPTRLDVLYPPDIINGLRQFAVLSQFRLQYPDTLTDVVST